MAPLKESNGKTPHDLGKPKVFVAHDEAAKGDEWKLQNMKS